VGFCAVQRLPETTTETTELTLREELKVIIGIDFGTTNSAVAMADEFGHVTTARYPSGDAEREPFLHLNNLAFQLLAILKKTAQHE